MRAFQLLALTIFLKSTLAFGQVQSQLTDESNLKLKNVEAELQTVQNKILEAYEEDKEFIKAFNKSQNMWTEFRAVELNMKYPKRAPGYYGSAHQMCVNDYLAEFTKDRIEKLRVWLIGTDEGDMCGGTVQWKD